MWFYVPWPYFYGCDGLVHSVHVCRQCSKAGSSKKCLYMIKLPSLEPDLFLGQWCQSFTCLSNPAAETLSLKSQHGKLRAGPTVVVRLLWKERFEAYVCQRLQYSSNGINYCACRYQIFRWTPKKGFDLAPALTTTVCPAQRHTSHLPRVTAF